MIRRRVFQLLILVLLPLAASGLYGQQLDHRGFMIDMSRMKERDEYYFDLVDQLALFGYNALYLHFSDDEGLTVQLESHPELVSKYAMSKETVRRLVEHATKAGIEIIPEVEAWGHAGWILDHHPQLADSTDTGTLAMGKEAVYALLDDVIGEVAGLFKESRYIHIGMDEAWYPAVPDTSAATDKQIAAHVKRVADMVRRRNRTPMMWADMVTHRPRVLAALPHDIVMVDWRYWINETAEQSRILQSAGFSVITAPAIMSYAVRVHPGPLNWENVRRMIGVARELKLQGTVVTAWLPQRYPPGVLPHAIAYSGYLMQDGAISLSEAMARFTRDYFGSRDSTLSAAFVRLAGIESAREDLQATFWHDSATFAARLSAENRARDAAYAMRTMGLADAFRAARGTARKNNDAYEAYVVLAELLEYLGRRRILPAAVQHAVDAAQAERARGNTGMARDRLETMITELRALEAQRQAIIGRLDAHWDRTRYPDHPLKQGGNSNSLMMWLKDEKYHSFSNKELVERMELETAKVGS